jgi:hypothetical protein
MVSGMDKVPLLFQPGSDSVYGCSNDMLGGVVEDRIRYALRSIFAGANF